MHRIWPVSLLPTTLSATSMPLPTPSVHCTTFRTEEPTRFCCLLFCANTVPAPKLAVLADALSLGGDTVSEKAERMIAAIEAMRDSFDIPSTLPHLSPNDYTEIARRALKEANPTYPVPQIWDSEKIFSVLRRVQS